MPTLLEISDDARAFDQLLAEAAENGGDITAVEATLNEWFSNISQDRDKKIDGYCALIREFEARASVRKEESERLAKRVKIDAAHAAFLKGRLKSFFEENNLKKIETDRYMVSLAKNGGAIPLELLDEPERFPAEFRTIKTQVVANTDAIRAALEGGQDLPFAKLGERGTRLSIK